MIVRKPSEMKWRLEERESLTTEITTKGKVWYEKTDSRISAKGSKRLPSRRTRGHVFICVLAYALWKTLDPLAQRAELQTPIRKTAADPSVAVAGPRPMTPETILRELSQIMIGDIERKTTDGRPLLFRRVARPNPEQKRILQALGIAMPERLSPDRVLS